MFQIVNLACILDIIWAKWYVAGADRLGKQRCAAMEN